MRLSHALFCAASLLICLGIAWRAFPYAAKTAAQIERAHTPQSAELFEDVDLGDFGVVPVLDLMQYYVDNPPAPSAGTPAKVRFQGC